MPAGKKQTLYDPPITLTKEDWQEWIYGRWEKQRRRNKTQRDLIAIMGLGLGGEAGEVQEHIKKYLRDGAFKRKEFLWELGDCLHYLTRIVDEFGFTLDEVMQANMDKLERRDRGERVG
jgi:NTP pyrophosphatase (non-canonical NTP hydrolase)